MSKAKKEAFSTITNSILIAIIAATLQQEAIMKEFKLITAHELAEIIRKSVPSIYNAVSEGFEGEKIPISVKIGRRRLWLMSDVQEWIENLPRTSVSTSSRVIEKKKPKLNEI